VSEVTLRSNLEVGTTGWAVRRSQWRALGIPAADMEKPKIAVVNSSSQLSVCFQHLDGVSLLVQNAIRNAGGLPFEIRTIAPSDFVTGTGREGRYLMPSRDLLVNDIEVVVEGAQLDGMICLASCDKTTPAHLMAAGRLDIPTVVFACGYQLGGHCGARGMVDIEDVYESIGALSAGTCSLEEVCELTEHAVKGPGVCAGLATANTMHILSEALGMSLPGTTPIRAGSAEMRAAAEAAGTRIVDLVLEDLRPRRILTREAFENAVIVDLAIAGSVNSLRHLQAIAVESEVDVDIYGLVEQFSDDVPVLCGIRPNGSDRIEDLDAAGGAAAVMKRLDALLHGDALSVAGRTIADIVSTATVRDENVVRPTSDPFTNRPGLVIVRGSLAPDGAIVRLPSSEHSHFSGPARVFETEREAIDALGDGGVGAGDVVVLRGLGPKGGPGTVFAASFVAALQGSALAAEVAVVTDGELSGLNHGLVIGQVMPEAAEGGPLAIVVEGDPIELDVAAKRIDLAISEAELQQRVAAYEPPLLRTERGWLGIYRDLVAPLSQGAVLRPSGDPPRVLASNRSSGSLTDDV
jgi:dihydroxy-acid dehydratase